MSGVEPRVLKRGAVRGRVPCPRRLHTTTRQPSWSVHRPYGAAQRLSVTADGWQDDDGRGGVARRERVEAEPLERNGAAVGERHGVGAIETERWGTGIAPGEQEQLEVAVEGPKRRLQWRAERGTAGQQVIDQWRAPKDQLGWPGGRASDSRSQTPWRPGSGRRARRVMLRAADTAAKAWRTRSTGVSSPWAAMSARSAWESAGLVWQRQRYERQRHVCDRQHHAPGRREILASGVQAASDRRCQVGRGEDRVQGAVLRPRGSSPSSRRCPSPPAAHRRDRRGAARSRRRRGRGCRSGA